MGWTSDWLAEVDWEIFWVIIAMQKHRVKVKYLSLKYSTDVLPSLKSTVKEMRTYFLSSLLFVLSFDRTGALDNANKSFFTPY